MMHTQLVLSLYIAKGSTGKKGGISAMFKPLAPKESDKPVAARGKKKKNAVSSDLEADPDMQITAINVKIEAAVSLVTI